MKLWHIGLGIGILFVIISVLIWQLPQFLDSYIAADERARYYVGFGVVGLTAVAFGLIVSLNEVRLTRQRKVMRTCPSCTAALSFAEERCPHCGFDISHLAKCKKCLAVYPRERSRCPNCGAPNVPESA